jgi:hypothetical protein
MATWTLRRFSVPETLRNINPTHLLGFLEPHRPFFRSRGVTLPQPDSDDAIDCQALARVFVSPDTKTPRDLIDALYFVDEMATDEGMDELLAEAEKQGLELEDDYDLTAADVAVQIWLLNKDILERKHAERYLEKVRSFEYFQMKGSPPRPFKRPTDKQLHDLSRDLDNWFERKKRGRGSRIIMGDQSDSVWFLVRHAEPFKREESMDGSETSSVCYRPIKYDVAIYSPRVRELQINARSNGEKELYCETFGKHLFGDRKIFPSAKKYTLDPLRELGEDSLAPGDIDGIDWIKLCAVQFYFGGNPSEVVTRQSDDLFALFKSREKPFPQGGRMIRANFRIKFSDAKTPRSVVIKPSNIAQFTRDDDSVLVEKWLEARGFIINAEADESEKPKKVLAGR